MVDEENGGTSRLSTNNVKVSPLYYAGGILKSIVLGIIAVAFVALLVYSFVLAPTSMRFVNTDTFGTVLTKDPTIKHGGIPAGKVELVTIGEKGDYLGSFGAKMKTAFSPHKHVSTMAILAGPDGRVLTSKTGEMLVNGHKLDGSTVPVNYEVLKDKKWYLSNQYVALCLGGDCKVGATYVINDGDVLGELKTTVTGKYEDEVNAAVKAQNAMYEKVGHPINEKDVTTQDEGKNSSMDSTLHGNTTTDDKTVSNYDYQEYKNWDVHMTSVD